jgi:uncharacterized membrane protein
MMTDEKLENLNVLFYYKEDCIECDKVETELLSIQADVPHNLIKINILSDESLRRAYQDSVPIIEAGPYQLKSPFTRVDLQTALGAAKDRKDRLEQDGDCGYRRRMEQGRKITGTDRFSLWISNHYMLVFNILGLLYLGLPFLAPVLEKAHYPAPAKIIYAIYSPLCHQLAFRSWFLFGEQAYYPRELAGISGKITYEQLLGSERIDLTEARNFIGNDQIGYKVAFCQRDIAIYGAILLFGLINPSLLKIK